MINGYIENIYQVTADVLVDDYKNGLIGDQEFIERKHDIYQQWLKDNEKKPYLLPELISHFRG